MATKMTIDDALNRMCKHSLTDMCAASNFERSAISALRSGRYPRTRFEKYINLLNYLYNGVETEGGVKYDKRKEN